MTIFVISSPDPIRQQNVKKQFASQNGSFSYELVPAVMMQTARYGIAKSHKRCVQIAKEHNWPSVWIAEDDVDFLSPDSLNKFALAMFDAPDDWDIFTGGLFSGEVVDMHAGYGKVSGSFSGLHLYCVKSKFYDTFLSVSETMNIDYEIFEILKANIYTAYPIVVKEISGYSYNSGKEENYSKELCKKYRCL